MTQSWNLIFEQKIIECARPASHFNLKNETSDFDYAIFGKGIQRSPATQFFQGLSYFFRNYHIF